ncbi:MAG: (d)CMP kinase [Myxococcota bacterium]
MSRPLTIAVDGPGSAGKGTVARSVARELGYRYVDTGAMYRAVAWAAHQRGVAWDDAEGAGAVARSVTIDFRWDGELQRVLCDSVDVTDAIRTAEMGAGASAVSVHPPVRDALLGAQRALGAGGGVVMDGRDIGTVVLPDADLKVFLDASLEERARRRHAELVARGRDVTLTEVTAALAARDDQDRNRAAAPLRKADDAISLDTTGLSIEQATQAVLRLARER